MAQTNLSDGNRDIITGNDNIVIVNVIDTVRGGRSLDVTGYEPEVINAGHVIIVETGTGVHKPMPIVDEVIDDAPTGKKIYGTLPAGHTYAGILIQTLLKKRAMASILVRGTVNPAASIYPLGTILTAVKAALPHILFLED